MYAREGVGLQVEQLRFREEADLRGQGPCQPPHPADDVDPKHTLCVVVAATFGAATYEIGRWVQLRFRTHRKQTQQRGSFRALPEKPLTYTGDFFSLAFFQQVCSNAWLS